MAEARYIVAMNGFDEEDAFEAAASRDRSPSLSARAMAARPAPYLDELNSAQRAALESVTFEDVCITSQIGITGDDAPAEAFRVPEVNGVAVVFEKAEGAKCARCWKVLPDVGTHAHPGVCGRCDAAVN